MAPPFDHTLTSSPTFLCSSPSKFCSHPTLSLSGFQANTWGNYTRTIQINGFAQKHTDTEQTRKMAQRPITQTTQVLQLDQQSEKEQRQPIALFPSVSFFTNHSFNAPIPPPPNTHTHPTPQQRGFFFSQSSLKIPQDSMPPSHLQATARHPAQGYH